MRHRRRRLPLRGTQIPIRIWLRTGSISPRDQGVYGTAIATVPAGALTYTVTGLTMGSTYYFRITAVDSAGDQKLPSNEVSKSIF